LNYLRSRRGVQVSLDDEEAGYGNLPSSWGNPEKHRENRELGAAIAGAVSALPESLRMPVILCKYHGMKYAEAAEIIGCTEGALKLRIFRAKAILAERLAPYVD
jgi:RNA polymerase sigma-70 factor (ECF subfamily)